MDLLELFLADVPVCDAGYTIRDGKIFPLDTREWEPGWPGYTFYNAFDYSGLFLDFAALSRGNKPTPDEDLIEFASRYGLLFSGYHPQLPAIVNRNTVKEWQDQIRNMRNAVQLWKTGHNSDALHHIYNGPVKLVAELNFKTDNLELQCESLLSALYLQLYFAIKGSKTFNECAWCGSWFEILPPATRNTRKFCSNACKQAEDRHRKGGK